MKQLHPGAKWLFRIRAWAGSAFILIFLSGFVFGIIGAFLGGGSGWFILFALVFYIALVIIIGEVYSRMAYNRWLYEFTKEGLKLERGVIWKRYSNVPYARVQNVDVHRGILARMLGFSTVNIQTAGFHMVARRGMPASEGHIPAVSIEEAERIRGMLMKKISSRGM